PESTRFDLTTPEGRWADLHLVLAGEHQARNAASAAAAALWLRAEGTVAFTDDQLRAGLGSAWIAGRLQVVQERPLLILDAAHSPDRAAALAQTIRALYTPVLERGRLILVIGCSRGHEPETVVRELAPLATEIIVTRSRHPAAVPAEELAEAARASGKPVRIIEPVAAAVETALAGAGTDDLVLVTGSLFAIAEVAPKL
ncbi:MAG: FolC bifunctional protein, partial [Armatimonadetes bacterium]|nr:FolC bifunctional protein [Armatimonadota bacterium]